MDTGKQNFDAQDAPEKNTDAAFVRVGTDGKPQLPAEKESTQNENTQSPKEGSLQDR